MNHIIINWRSAAIWTSPPWEIADHHACWTMPLLSRRDHRSTFLLKWKNTRVKLTHHQLKTCTNMNLLSIRDHESPCLLLWRDTGVEMTCLQLKSWSSSTHWIEYHRTHKIGEVLHIYQLLWKLNHLGYDLSSSKIRHGTHNHLLILQVSL